MACVMPLVPVVEVELEALGLVLVQQVLHQELVLLHLLFRFVFEL